MRHPIRDLLVYVDETTVATYLDDFRHYALRLDSKLLARLRWVREDFNRFQLYGVSWKALKSLSKKVEQSQ